jgi:hypothetical protein
MGTERRMGLAETKFDEAAIELLSLIDEIGDEEELRVRLKDSKWRTESCFYGLDLMWLDENSDSCVVVTIDPGWGVEVTTWKLSDSATMPVRLDRRMSSWTVFPKYEVRSNVFDRMNQLGRRSILSLTEVNNIMMELNESLRG